MKKTVWPWLLALTLLPLGVSSAVGAERLPATGNGTADRRASLPGSATLKPGDVPLRRPVVFSYNHPWGSDKNPNEGWTDPWFMDFGKVNEAIVKHYGLKP